jgi:hypothetical protein
VMRVEHLLRDWDELRAVARGNMVRLLDMS